MVLSWVRSFKRCLFRKDIFKSVNADEERAPERRCGTVLFLRV
jgi:hypothetical protein